MSVAAAPPAPAAPSGGSAGPLTARLSAVAPDVRRDRWIALALAAAATAYVASFPHHLGDADESQLLYESLRLLDGAVYFRDLFDNIPPGTHLLYALLFALFGAGMTVARLTTAALHGAIVALTYRCARGVGAPPALAAAAGLAHLAFGQPAWPYASPHWLSALLTLVLLWVGLRRPWARRDRGAAWLGVVIGVLATVHHQKAAILAVGAAALLTADAALDRRFTGAVPWAALWRRLAWMCGALLAVALPFFAALVLWAGWDAVVFALVEFPLRHYGGTNRAAWGEVNFLTVQWAAYTVPLLLKYLPLALPVVAVRAALLAARRRQPELARGLTGLLVVALFAMASIGYFPDFIHITFVAPILWIAVAAALAPLSAWLAAGRVRLLAPAAAALLLLGLAVPLASHLRRAYAEFPLRFDTPFGRLAARDAVPVALAEQVRQIVDGAGSRELLCYPAYAAMYLMTGTRNPTPFQTLITNYNPPEAFAAARATLESRRVPVVLVAHGLTPPRDPFLDYVRAHYDRVGGGRLSQAGDVSIYRRKPEPPGSP